MKTTDDGVTNVQIQRFKRRVRNALATMYLLLGDEQSSSVRSAKTAKEA